MARIAGRCTTCCSLALTLEHGLAQSTPRIDYPVTAESPAIVSAFRATISGVCMKLSVAMITYNHKRFIGQAIESVLAQKVNFDYELVIGEDCSTDGTRSVILDFQRRYPERIVCLLRERNIGAMRNLSGTIAACRGQYLAILEGDDYWSCTSKLQKQVDFLDAHPDWAICCSRAEVRNEDDMHFSKLRVQTGAVFPARPDSTRPNAQDVSGLLPAVPRAAGTYTLEDLLPENFIPTCTVLYRWGSCSRRVSPHGFSGRVSVTYRVMP